MTTKQSLAEQGWELMLVTMQYSAGYRTHNQTSRGYYPTLTTPDYAAACHEAARWGDDGYITTTHMYNCR